MLAARKLDPPIPRRAIRKTSTAIARWETPLRLTAAAFFVAAGVNHFVKPRFYEQIIPPGFPSPKALVAISGVAEIAGGVGLLIRPLRRAAGWGLIAMLLAIYPANIYMAMEPNREPQRNFPRWTLFARLPLQAVFIGWVWAVSLRQTKSPEVNDPHN